MLKAVTVFTAALPAVAKRPLFLAALKLALLAAFIFYEGLGSRLFRYFAFEILLLEAFFLCRHIIVKGVGVLLLLLHIAHLTNVFSTGLLMETETLLNLTQYSSLSSATLIKLSLFSILCLLIWMPSILRKGYFGGIKYLSSLCIILALSFSFLPRLPFRHLAEKTSEAWIILNYRNSPQADTLFHKVGITSGAVPFAVKDYNVIVIFTEGTSYRVLSNELTPNAMALANKSLCFNNYFSHTAATFRGLRGQLMSGYQLRGGYYQDKSGLGQMSKERMKTVLRKDINIISIVKNHGYVTYFASPHRTPDPFNNFLEYIGFDNVISYKSDSDISDKELYQNLTELAVKVHTSRKKFFLATYVVGSHHGYDSPDLKYGDGSNSYLNKFHNQDHWFGQFLQKLEAAGVLENTLLVYTSDHATYPSAEFRKTFQSDVPYFADRIPLFIYTKGITPRTVDARNQNSLCLAPTLLDLLDLRNEENCFLGNSLFSRSIGEFSRLTNIGFDFFDTSGGRVVPIKPEAAVLEKVKAFFNIFG